MNASLVLTLISLIIILVVLINGHHEERVDNA